MRSIPRARGGRCTTRAYGRSYKARPDDRLVYQMAIGSPVADATAPPARSARRQPSQPHARALPRRLGSDRRVRRAVGPTAAARARETGAARHRGVALQRDRPDRRRLHAHHRRPVLPRHGRAHAGRRSRRPRAPRRRAGADGTNWLFVGRVTANKAQHDLVKALATYRGLHRPAARLHLVGGGVDSTYGRAVRAYSEALGVADAGRDAGRGVVRGARRVLRRRRRLRLVQRTRGLLRPDPRGDGAPRPGRRVRRRSRPGNRGRRRVAARLEGSRRVRHCRRAGALRLPRCGAAWSRGDSSGCAPSIRSQSGGRSSRRSRPWRPREDSPSSAPRYGDDIAGGAETAARLLATELVARTDWRVDVLTTTARDATTWANDFRAVPVSSTVSTVHRFPVERTRRVDFDRLCARLLYRPRRASAAEQVAWVEEQGPYSPALVAAIAASDADVVAFHPYLYYPTVVGLPLVARRAVLHPAAHDEQPIRLPIFRATFAADGRARLLERGRAAVHRTALPGRRPDRSSSSASASSPDPAIPRPRGPRSASVTSRSCCASGASTTARGRACSLSASRGTRNGVRAT